MPIETSELDRLPQSRKPGSIPPFCVGCGYNLAGSVSPRCPECGRTFVLREWQQKAAEVLRQIEQIKDANEWLKRGCLIAICGLGLTIFRVLVAGACVADVLRAISGLCGVGAVFLGLAVFRVERPPAWAAESIAPQPKYDLGGVLITLGVAAGASVFYSP